MALKAYFDGSRTDGRSLTLAVAAGDDQAWAALENDWRTLLTRSNAAYMHMTDAMHLAKEFKGWDESRRDWLVNALATTIQIHQGQSGGRIALFTTSVDLVAHREVNALKGWLPSPARMCVRGLFAKVFAWYCEFPDPILDVVDLYFDRGEPFMEDLFADWRSEEFRARFPVWNLVRTIEPVEMRQTPAIQVADMYAWARNRVEGQTDDRFFAVAKGMININGSHFAFDRAKLMTYEPFTII